eukprot:gb/GECH01009869.1/.p1 GENE.gb/GECH01009869.1/~~gb/GECH01009869.1/.p1  ORF type:complete len:300 (+),score=60.32 gb/GECH01009869.1/:1-900(+)
MQQELNPYADSKGSRPNNYSPYSGPDRHDYHPYPHYHRNDHNSNNNNNNNTNNTVPPNPPPPPPPTTCEVKRFLDQHHLSDLWPTFQHARVTSMHLLKQLEPEDYVQMGIPVGAKRQIINLLHKNKNNNNSSNNNNNNADETEIIWIPETKEPKDNNTYTISIEPFSGLKKTLMKPIAYLCYCNWVEENRYAYFDNKNKTFRFISHSTFFPNVGRIDFKRQYDEIKYIEVKYDFRRASPPAEVRLITRNNHFANITDIYAETSKANAFKRAKEVSEITGLPIVSPENQHRNAAYAKWIQ